MTYILSGISPKPILSWLVVILLFFAWDTVAAQSVRDPTSPPKVLVPTGSQSAADLLDIEPGTMTIIVRNGRPYLVIDTLFYAQGDKIGKVLIERITETEIWLRAGGVLRKLSQFPGVQRRMVTPHIAAPTCVPHSFEASSTADPCFKAQP
jgi:hypothetical protein